MINLIKKNKPLWKSRLGFRAAKGSWPFFC